MLWQAKESFALRSCEEAGRPTKQSPSCPDSKHLLIFSKEET